MLEEGLEVQICGRCNNKNERKISKIVVDINENNNYGLANFTVVNAQTLKPISGASIFISTENDGENTFFTDENGNVSIVLPVGTQNISAYAKNCLVRNLTVKIKPGVNDVPKIGLSDLNTYDAKVTSKLMDLDEIKEAGIDTTDPSNNHVYKYELKLNFEPEVDIPSIIAYFNSDGKFIGGHSSSGSGDTSEGGDGYTLHYHVGSYWWHSWCKTEEVKKGQNVSLSYRPERGEDYVFDGWYEDPEYTKKISTVNIKEKSTWVYGRWIYVGTGTGTGTEPTPGIPVKVKDETLTVYPVSENFWLIIRGKVKWLKEMFDVEMLVINNSNTDTLENLTATLELPEGLSLAKMIDEQQTLQKEIDNIAEGESKSVHWYVRGDTAGTYSLKAGLKGTIMPFEEPIDDVFIGENQLQVLAGDALHLDFEFPNAAYYGEDYPITITLTNVSDITLYNISHTVQIEQGMSIYYSNGKKKEKIEKSRWETIGIEEFKPGDKLIIEASVNIFFESEIMQNYLNKLCNMVSGVETLIKGFEAVTTALNLFSKLTKGIVKASKALALKGATLESISTDKKKATAKLYDAISSLYTKCSKFDNKSVDSGAKLTAFGVGEILDVMAADNVLDYLSGKSVKDIEDMVKKVTTFTESFEATDEDIKNFDIFDSIRTMISAIPIRFVLKSVVMTEDENNTTEIPWSYTVSQASAQYFGVSNVSSYISNIMKAIAAEVWDKGVSDNVGLLNLIPGVDDPFNYDEIKRNIIATEKEIENFQAKDATGEVRFKAYYVENKNSRLRSAIAGNGYTLECDNETAEFKDGVLTFTGEGLISFTPLNTNGGTLYIEDSEGNTYTYIIDVVEQHECKASEEQRVILSPTDEYDGFAVKCCEICDDIMDIITLSASDCENHSFGEWITESESTCKTCGVATRSCTSCGYNEIDLIDAISHTEKTVNDVKATCTSDGYTGDVICEACGETLSVGETIKSAGHDYSNWTTTKELSCTSDGEKKKTCSVCGDIVTETITALGHDYSKDWTIDVETTCTKTGLKSHHCSRCDSKSDITEIAANGHNYNGVVTEPTCTEDGYTTHTCSVCGDSYKDSTVAALGHTGGTATCKKQAVCTTCGESYGELDSNNHTNIVTDKAVAATCSKTGFTEGSHCIDCNKVIVAQKTTEKKPHNEEVIKAVDATCTKTGLTEGKKCSVCGEILVAQKEIAKIAHKYTSVVTPPTCTEKGYTTYACSCGDTYVGNETAALGHYDSNGDGQCDSCGKNLSATQVCSCMCHKSGFSGFIWKILKFLYKLFGTNEVCDCGAIHY